MAQKPPIQIDSGAGGGGGAASKRGGGGAMPMEMDICADAGRVKAAARESW